MKKIVTRLLLFLTPTLFFGQQIKYETFALAAKIIKPVKVDGLLNESDWRRAQEASVFIQQHPDRFTPHVVEISVKILYDDDHIYFGFNCFDSEPEKIRDQTTTIDGDLRDDYSVYILINKANDTSNYYYFATNSLGIPSEGKVSKDGQIADPSWNGDWRTAAQKTDFGWSAEIAIELGIIFEYPGESKTFGLGLSRIVPRLDNIFHAGPLDPAFELDQLGYLKTLDLSEPWRGVRVKPHVISESEVDRKHKPGVGIDVQYGFSQWTRGSITLNPDFATVEPDFERINLTPFELYLPEKRNFFREGEEIYQNNINLFYSKRIGDILGGVKLQGRYGAYDFSIMSVQRREDDYLDEGSANFSVFRLKREIGNSSSIGFMASNNLLEETNRGAAGVDVDFIINKRFKISGQFALSYGDYKKDNLAFFLGTSYDSSTWHIHLNYVHLGKYFGNNVDSVGYIPDDNRRELGSAINKTFPFDKWFFKRIRYHSNFNIYWGMNGTLRSWRIDQGLSFDLKRKFIISFQHIQEHMLNEGYVPPKLIYAPSSGEYVWTPVYWNDQIIGWEYQLWKPGTGGSYYEGIKDFRNHQTRIMSEFYAEEWKQFGTSVTFGRNFTSGFWLFEVHKAIKVTSTFFINYNLYYLNYGTEIEPFAKSNIISVFKATLYATKNLQVKFFLQSNRDVGKVNLQMHWIYNINSYSSILLGYQKGTGRFGEKGTQDHTLFLKLGYTF